MLRFNELLKIGLKLTELFDWLCHSLTWSLVRAVFSDCSSVGFLVAVVLSVVFVVVVGFLVVVVPDVYLDVVLEL